MAPPNMGAVRRLLRQHPKLHPDSASAAEFRALGLGSLPFLEWDVEQPWGRLLESPTPVTPRADESPSPKLSPRGASEPTDLSPRPDAGLQTSDENVSGALKDKLGNGMHICVLGSTSYRMAGSEALVAALGEELERSLPGVGSFVTGGMPGVQRTFAEHCGDGSKVWNLVLLGETSGYDVGQDIPCSSDAEARRVLLGKLGDAYVSVEGGPGTAQEARMATDRGAIVIPMIRSGGASAGAFNFPSALLEKPTFADPVDWALLSDEEAHPVASAQAVARLIAAGLGLPTPSKPSHLPSTSQFLPVSGVPSPTQEASGLSETVRLAALEAEEAALLEEVLALDNRQPSGASTGQPSSGRRAADELPSARRVQGDNSEGSPSPAAPRYGAQPVVPRGGGGGQQRPPPRHGVQPRAPAPQRPPRPQR